MKSICILRLSAIGDVCNALATVQAIANAYPDAKITWIVGKTEANLLRGLPRIRLVEFDKKQGFRGIFAVWRRLRGEKFDVLLNMQSALRASLLSLGVRAKTKWGLSPSRAREGQKWFVDRQVDEAPTPHVLDGFMMFAKAIGVVAQSPKWDLPIADADRDYAAQFVDSSRQTWLIAPCSSKKEKDWAVENYIALLKNVPAERVQLIVVGANFAYEQQAAAQICAETGALNLAGKTNLLQLTALIGQSDLLIASDSGPAHLATTQNTPVIGLYAIHNPKRTAPYLSQELVVSVYDELVEKEYGKPWTALPWATKVHDKNAMAQISVARVEAALQPFLNREKTENPR